MSEKTPINKRLAEKDFYLKGPEALTIKELLQIPYEFRTFQHCKEIIKYVKVFCIKNELKFQDVKFLQKYMESDQIFDLVKEFRLRQYKPHHVVFRQGDEADAFYIILKGEVKVFIDSASELKHFTNQVVWLENIDFQKEVMELKEGDAFGELALLYDSTRTATIVTSDYTDLIMLDKDSFRKHITSVQTKHIAHIIDFFKNFPAFQNMNQSEIITNAGKCVMHRFPSNTVVLRQGLKPEAIYFIQTGRFKVVRKLKFKANPITKRIIKDPEDPTPEDIEAGRYKEMQIEIDELSHGDSFGDYAALNDEEMAYSVISLIPCELIGFSIFELRLMNPQIVKEYKILCKPYPDDTELRRIYLDMLKWDDWRKRLTNNILIEKSNLKLGFNGQLRQPFKKLLPLESIGVDIASEKSDQMLSILAPHAMFSVKYLKKISDPLRFDATMRATPLSKSLTKKSFNTRATKDFDTTKDSKDLFDSKDQIDAAKEPNEVDITKDSKETKGTIDFYYDDRSTKMTLNKSPSSIDYINQQFGFVTPRHKVGKKNSRPDLNPIKKIESKVIKTHVLAPSINKSTIGKETSVVDPSMQVRDALKKDTSYFNSTIMKITKKTGESTTVDLVSPGARAKMGRIFTDLGVEQTKLPPILAKLDYM